MTMPWFRMYTEARRDAKLRRLTDGQFRIWFNLLCLAAEQSERGLLAGFDLSLLADDVSNGDCNALVSTLEALQALRVVTCTFEGENDAYEITFANFEKRQAPKPSDARDRVRERVARSRQRKKSASPFNFALNTSIAPVSPCIAPVSRDIDQKEKEKREEDTPLPPEGDDVGGKGFPEASKPKSPLRSQQSRNPEPKLIADLETWATRTLGDLAEEGGVLKNIASWAASYELDWIETAILCAKANPEVGSKRICSYINTCMSNWWPSGPTKDERKQATAVRAAMIRRPDPTPHRAPKDSVYREVAERTKAQ